MRKMVHNYDIAVIGSGAGGLAAATFAALSGAKTVLIESTEYVGGTSAYSAGTTWAPNTRLAATVGGEDSPERVMTYLDHAVGNRSPRELRAAFVENAKHAIHTLMDQSEAQFRAYAKHPDYLSELEGSAEKGRALEPLPFKSSVLGKDMALIRPPDPRVYNPWRIDGGPHGYWSFIEDDQIPHIPWQIHAPYRRLFD